MADKKKDHKELLYNLEILVVLVLSFFMLLGVTGGGRICLMGGLASAQTISSVAASMMALVIFHNACGKKKEGGGVKEFPAAVTGAALVFCLVCLICGIAKDMKDTKIRDEYHISEEKSIVLTETTVKNKYTETVRSHITVYLKGGLTAKKLGEVDESMFALNCIESGNYDCDFNEATGVFTLTCYHGGYGNGIANLISGESSLSYSFPVSYQTKGEKKSKQQSAENE